MAPSIALLFYLAIGKRTYSWDCNLLHMSQLAQSRISQRLSLELLLKLRPIVQTLNFSCAEPNVNDLLCSLFELVIICIRFGR